MSAADSILALLQKSGQCCMCEGSMASTRRLNMVQLNKKASWKFLTWTNILIDNAGDRAVAVICDSCAETRLVPGAQCRYALELQEKTVPAARLRNRHDPVPHFSRLEYERAVYHEIGRLEDAFPITDEMVREAERRNGL